LKRAAKLDEFCTIVPNGFNELRAEKARRTERAEKSALTAVRKRHGAEDNLGRRRNAFCIVAKQLLLLRARSAAKAAASSFYEPPTRRPAGLFAQESVEGERHIV
jgi:hypothetical protein